MALDNNNGTRRPHTADQVNTDVSYTVPDSTEKNISSLSEQNISSASSFGAASTTGAGKSDAYHRSNPYLSEFARERAEVKQRLTSGEGAQHRTSGDARTDGYGNPIGERSDAARRGATALDDYDLDSTRQTGASAYGRTSRTTTTSADDYDLASDRPVSDRSAARTRTLNTVTEGVKDTEIARQLRAKRKRAKRNQIIAMVVIEAITLAFIFAFGFVHRYIDLKQDVDFNKSVVENTNIDLAAKEAMTGYWTVAVFGVDSRDGNVGKGSNADVQIIANADMATGDVTLVSVYRDTYLNLGKGTRYAKINEAYADGGPEQAVAALNKNLDLNIQNYITFNWKAVADAIDMLGGVDIDVTKAEFYYMNAYITETCLKAGITKNPAAHYLKQAGQQHLDGAQAVAYARLRYMDNDFERTRRQREVIEQCLANAKKADLATLTQIIDTVLPQTAFNIDTADIVELARGVSRYNIKESQGFPFDLKGQMMGKKGDCVIPNTLSSNVSKLHEILFGVKNYKPSSAVETYSQKIMDDVAMVKASAAADSTRSTADLDEGETETDENGKVIKKHTATKETDEDGYIIKGTDADGDPIYETDADGNKVKASTKSTKASTTETDEDGYIIKGTDSDGNNIYETDADGNKVKASTKNTKETTASSTTETDSEGYIIKGTDPSGDPVYETDADGNKVKASTKNTKETTSSDETTKSNEETSGTKENSNTKETKETTEANEPGQVETTTAEVEYERPGVTKAHTETTKASSETTKSNNAETVSEPGANSDSGNTTGGPGSGSTGNVSTNTNGPA